MCLSDLKVPALKYSQSLPPGHTHSSLQQRAHSAQGATTSTELCVVKTTLVSFWSFSSRPRFYVPVSGTLLSSPVWRVNLQCLGDGADGAATLVLHGLPPFQLSGDPPPDSLQVQASVKLSRAQGDTRKTTNKFRI